LETEYAYRALARDVIHDVIHDITDGRRHVSREKYGGRPSMTSSRDVTASPLLYIVVILLLEMVQQFVN
jgi:hypothetical protein